jgi:hypothetical protein
VLCDQGHPLVRRWLNALEVGGGSPAWGDVFGLQVAAVGWREMGLVWQHLDFAGFYREGQEVVGHLCTSIGQEDTSVDRGIGQSFDTSRMA